MDPDKTKAVPFQIGSNEAVVIMELEEWVAVWQIVEAVKENATDLTVEEHLFIDRIFDKIQSWVNNSGFKDYPKAYLES